MVEHKRFGAYKRNRSVPNPAEDVQRLNERLLLIVSDPSAGGSALRAMGAGTHVARRIRAANAQALATAIRCSVPLIVFTPAVEECVASDPRLWRWNTGTHFGAEIRELTLFALTVAHDLALRNITMAKLYFGVSRMAAERLAELAVANLEMLSRAPRPLLKLRCGDDSNWWTRLLIGDRVTGPRAARIAQMAAQRGLNDK